MADRDIILSQLPAALIKSWVIAQNIVWFSPVIVAFFWYRYDRVKIEQGQRRIAENVRRLVLHLENNNNRAEEQNEHRRVIEARLLQLETANNDRHERDAQPQPIGIFEIERDQKGTLSGFKYNSPSTVHEENIKINKVSINYKATKIPTMSRHMD